MAVALMAIAAPAVANASSDSGAPVGTELTFDVDVASVTAALARGVRPGVLLGAGLGFGPSPILGRVFVSSAHYADKPSVYPQLASETNIGPTARMDYWLFVSTLVPANGTEALPAGVERSMVRPAKLHGIGPFVDPNVMHINRLAAIPGTPPSLSDRPSGCPFEPRCRYSDRTGGLSAGSRPPLRQSAAGQFVACHLADETRAGIFAEEVQPVL